MKKIIGVKWRICLKYQKAISMRKTSQTMYRPHLVINQNYCRIGLSSQFEMFTDVELDETCM